MLNSSTISFAHVRYCCKKNILTAITILILTLSSACAQGKPATPFEKHGKLHVEGTQLVDKNNEPYQLYGMSTHGITWYPQYLTQKTFTSLRDSWNTNCIRIAMYTYENGGYCTTGNKEKLKKQVTDAVGYATNLGMYAIIDWHILNENTPNAFIEQARIFFAEMSKKYAKQDNVIYEICNEPNGCDWYDIYDYANEIIPIIRKNNPDAIILVGTPTWSQEVDKVVYYPLEYDNIMYVVHFYAATHGEWLRSRVEDVLEQGIPVFISEFGMCTADGKGKNNLVEAQKWMDLINEKKLSFFCWNLSNGGDTCCVFKRTCRKLSDWTDDDLSDSGKWIVDQFKKETNQ